MLCQVFVYFFPGIKRRVVVLVQCIDLVGLNNLVAYADSATDYIWAPSDDVFKARPVRRVQTVIMQVVNQHDCKTVLVDGRHNFRHPFGFVLQVPSARI